MTRPLLRFLLLPLAAALVTCSEAETPKGFDGGSRDGGSLALADGGAGSGNRDQPCVNGLCNTPDLACVRERLGDELCRQRCDRADPSDPCGPGAACGALSNGSGACLPAGGLDESCPCDEGLACTRLPGPDGGPEVSFCKTTCELDAEPGCPAPLRCRPLAGSETGVCVE